MPDSIFPPPFLAAWPAAAGLLLLHGLLWGGFLLARLLTRGRAAGTGKPAIGQEASVAPVVAPHARRAVLLHGLAFGVMYFGIFDALGRRLPAWSPWRGTLLLLAGLGLMAWALRWFASWRLSAELTAAHRLATGGPFRWVRHPIYVAMLLVAVGSLLWFPTPVEALSVLMMALFGDYRARVEEGVMRQVFGADYATYSARTARFLPGVY